MKIIKSLLLAAVCLSATTLLHAQEIKTASAKPVQANIPEGANNKPSPQPELKPQPQVAAIATEAPAAVLETPSPLKIDKDSKPVQNMSAEQAKILAGKTERPKPAAPTPNTIDPNARPVPTKPAVEKVQQQ
jgi:hypothetical protein